MRGADDEVTVTASRIDGELMPTVTVIRRFAMVVVMRGVTGLCLLLGGAAPAFAQAQAQTQRHGFELGVKGGLNIANAKIEGETGGPSLDPRYGLVAGVFATIPLSSWLDLQPEALYAMKGGRLDLDGIKSTLALDYVEVPVLARVTRGAGRRRYYVAGGPSFGLRVRARSRVDFGSSTEDIDVADSIERLDLGVAVGGGLEAGALVFDGRYTFGLKDVDKDKSDTVKVTNRAFSFTVGFRF